MFLFLLSLKSPNNEENLLKVNSLTVKLATIILIFYLKYVCFGLMLHLKRFFNIKKKLNKYENH